jgi:hypothetical protein
MVRHIAFEQSSKHCMQLEANIATSVRFALRVLAVPGEVQLSQHAITRGYLTKLL